MSFGLLSLVDLTDRPGRLEFCHPLARSVIYSRQGNPAWVNQKRDGQIQPIRSDDQFFGNAATQAG